MIVEGPSGIGKTTAIEKAIADEGLAEKVTKLSARKKEDVEYISSLREICVTGLVLIDDFHKLDGSIQAEIADLIKVLADESSEELKIVVIGINDSGKLLIEIEDDITNRNDIVPMESKPNEKIIELLEKGEAALNIILGISDEIAKDCNGSFYLAQMLAYEACIKSNILEASDLQNVLAISSEAVKSAVWRRLDDRFRSKATTFCEGVRKKREGRAPYLHILKWLSEEENWVLNVREAARNHASMRGSVSQVIEKGYLKQLFADNPSLAEQLHYDTTASKLVVEDPQFIFYIRNIPWAKFSNDLGFKDIFQSRYDFALSFAGSARPIAEAIFRVLSEEELEVFYDKNEQHRIIATDVEDYLHPIYQSEAKFVICIINDDYPKRIWTKFEEKAMAKRVGESIIPILIDETNPSAFSSLNDIGYMRLSRDLDNKKIGETCGVVLRKYHEPSEAPDAARLDGTT
ncbi:MAG: TIR domain-containing protein [Pseudomonadota bacterium]